MSAYRGRTGPNFSEFLNNLNSLSPYEENNFSADPLDVDSELAMFTNTDFTALDMALPEDTAFNYNLTPEDANDMKFQDMLGADPQAFNPGPINPSSTDAATFYSNYNTPIQPAPSNAFSTDNHSLSAPGHPSQQAAESSESHSVPPEDPSRVAAEEDKRRRNTAASARFRVKKKQREQALEKSVKEVNEKNSKLQAKLDQLEMENKWLKNLITEKNATQSKEEIDEAFQRFKRESEERQDVKAEAPRVKGVGTQ